ncbi:MAG: NAD-dependent epimerase/dehydratase family protein [Pseudomonadales bacterium]|nr:NAD-dependent epimerase/dehydratase family protein [Pseudomonadales bacterium]
MRVSNILIAGCGDVGSRLALRLSNSGCKVWGIRRNASVLPGFIQGISANLTDDENFPALPTCLDAVVYCVAASGFSEELYRDAYLLGLQNLLDQIHIQNIPVKRILFTSSTAVYSQRHGEWVDENSDVDPEGFSGRVMLEAEQCLADSGLEYASVRFGGIYGSGRARFITSVKEGRLKICDSYPQYTNRIHSDDCAGVLEHLLELECLEACYVAVDCAPVSKQEVGNWMAEQLGVGYPATVSQSDIKGGQNKRCKNTRLLASGYQFLYPDYKAGYAALLGQPR